MKRKIEDFFKQFIVLKTRKKLRIIIAVGLVVGAVKLIFCDFQQSELILKFDTINVELGQTVSTNIDDYLDKNKLSNKVVKKIIKETKEKDNLKYVKVINKDEDGKVISKEEKDYPEVGNYEMHFIYGNEVATIKVIVKDTTKPEIKAPTSIDIFQYTDLSTFSFDELLEVMDYSDVKDWIVDTSKIDVNTVGTYKLKVSIQDKYKNKATKTLDVNVREIPNVSNGEVAVTEIFTDENGNKKTIVIKKSSDEVSENDIVASNLPISNKEIIKNDATNTKPTTNNGKSISSTSSDSNDSDNTNNIVESSNEHKHNYNIPITEVVHHDAQIKVVHHGATLENQPLYEKHIFCKVCGKDFGKYGTDDAIDHSCDTGHSYHSIDVQVGSKEVIVKQAYDENIVVQQAYDETVTKGYKCTCGSVK